MTEQQDQSGPVCVSPRAGYFYGGLLNSVAVNIHLMETGGGWIKHAARTRSENCQSWTFAAILAQ